MSKASTIVRYDGSALAEHSMDVADLAPALLGLSEIVKLANKEINGERSQVRVLVKVDVEQKCFQFSIEVVQTILQHVEPLLDNDNISTAHELLEWIGIVVSGAIGMASGHGLLQLYKWLFQQGVTLDELLARKEGNQVTLRNVINNGTITINQNVYKMANNADALEITRKVVRPLTKDGYEKLQFEQDDQIVDEISSDEGTGIYNLMSDAFSLQAHTLDAISHEVVRVKKPDLLAFSKWEVVSLVLNKTIRVKIEDEAWLEKFHNREVEIPPQSLLSVVLRTQIELDDNNNPTKNKSYFILQVKTVIPPHEQTGLFN